MLPLLPLLLYRRLSHTRSPHIMSLSTPAEQTQFGELLVKALPLVLECFPLPVDARLRARERPHEGAVTCTRWT